MSSTVPSTDGSPKISSHSRAVERGVRGVSYPVSVIPRAPIWLSTGLSHSGLMRRRPTLSLYILSFKLLFAAGGAASSANHEPAIGRPRFRICLTRHIQLHPSPHTNTAAAVSTLLRNALSYICKQLSNKPAFHHRNHNAHATQQKVPQNHTCRRPSMTTGWKNVIINE